jgi:sialate O-acetylesterase
VETTADAEGKWMVKLPAMEVGAPGDLIIEGTNRVVLNNVVVGEVWVGSGQSNMWNAGYIDEDPPLREWLEKGPYPDIRIFRSPSDRRSDRGPMYWVPASKEAIKSSSALLFSFGLQLNRELGVPIGLILCSVAGTPSGAWLSQQALDEDPAVQAQIAAYRVKYEKQQLQYQKSFEEFSRRKAAGEDVKEPAPPPKPGRISIDENPGQLYESFIRPIIPYAISGVLWDQGEGGTGMRDVGQYEAMGALIRGWRKDWGQGDFPFFAMQKPSGGGCAWNPEDPMFSHAAPFEELPAEVPPDRLNDVENYLRIGEYPNTFIVGTTDICPPLGTGDVNTHPRSKSGSGRRAAYAVLQATYNKPVVGFGPTAVAATRDGSAVRVRFEHVGEGLAWRHGNKLQGFALAGADGKWHWADGTIEGNEVVVSSPAVPEPAKVKYALTSSRLWANLFNKNGLPAVPFQMTVAAVHP